MTQTLRRPAAPSTLDRPTNPTATTRPLRQFVRFAAVGIVSTLGYAALYLLLRGVLGATTANVVALLLTAVANTAANRRLTFGVTGRRSIGRHQLEGLGVLALGLALTTGALTLLTVAVPQPGRIAELAVLTSANLAGTVLRFVLFRTWVFRPGRHRTR